MNTPAHLLFGAAAFGNPRMSRLTWAALAGSMLPDLSLYVMAGVSLYILELSPDTVFNELYFSDAWQQVFAVDNSVVLWSVVIAVALWRRMDWLVALAGAALFHIALDFPLHAEDARMHFWPLTDWKFISPISYWEGAKGGNIVTIIELTLVACVTAWLLHRYQSWRWRGIFLALAAAQLLPALAWMAMF